MQPSSGSVKVIRSTPGQWTGDTILTDERGQKWDVPLGGLPTAGTGDVRGTTDGRTIWYGSK